MGIRYYASGDPVIRQRTVEARSAAVRAQAADPYTAEVARTASEYRGNWPHMRPGEILPLATAGVSSTDPLAREVATRSAVKRKRTTGDWYGLRDVVAGGTRGLTASLMAPLEVAQGALRSGITALPGHLGEVGGGVAVGAALGSVVPGVGTAIGAGVGAAIGGVAGLLAPEVEGTPQNPLLQSTLGQRLIKGESLGEGFFAWGDARRAQEKVSARAAHLPGGLAITPGRLIASSVFEPGETAFNLVSGTVDAGVALSRLDPTSSTIRGLTKAKRAGIIGSGKDFALMAEREVASGDIAFMLNRKAAGLAQGPRKDLVPEMARNWFLTSKPGQRIVQALADEDSFEAIRKALPQVDTETHLALKNARAPDEVMAIMEPHLGTRLTQAPKAKGLGDPLRGYTVGRRPGDSRILSAMPKGELNLNRPTEALEEFNRLQLNIKVPFEARSAANEKMAEALTSGAPEGKLRASEVFFDSMFGGDAGALVRNGTDPNNVASFKRKLLGWQADQQRYFRDATAHQADPGGINIGGRPMPLPIASIFAGDADVIRMNRATIRDMRRQASKMEGLLTSKSWDFFSAGADGVMQVWRPLVLLRGAWTVRVIAEEQIRMAAAGGASLFSHPLSFVALAAADDGTLARALQKLGRPGEHVASKLGRLGGGVVGEFDEMPVSAQAMFRGEVNEFAEGMGRRTQANAWANVEGADPRRSQFVAEQSQHTYQRHADGRVDVGFDEALRDKIAELNRNPIARRLANGESIDEVREWLVRGEGGASILKPLIAEPGGAQLKTLAGVDRLLESTKAEVMRTAGVTLDARVPTLGDDIARQTGEPLLLRAIADGELDGVPLLLRNGDLSPDFTRKLAGYSSLGRGPEQIVGVNAGSPTFKARLDDITAKLFDTFMARPSAKMSRSPTFRQQYWRKMEDLIPSMTKADQQQALAQARKFKVGNEQMARLEKRVSVSFGNHTVVQMDAVAKREALTFTRDLLYDAANRGQLSDALRLVAPFMEAQKEVLTRWAKLGTAHPQTIRRAQQTIHGARGAGFFYFDPQANEEMFAYPGSEWLTERTLGLPIKLGGRTQGLSMFGSGIMPGFGPAVQVPAGWLLPDRPELDGIRKFINPMGTQEEPGKPEDIPGSAMGAFVPSWAKSLLTAVMGNEEDRVFGNMVIDVFRSGVSSGKYPADSLDDIRDSMDAAKRLARGLFLIRMAGALGGAPTTVTSDYMAKDRDGKWLMADIVRQDYRKMQDGLAVDLDGNPIDPEEANEAFVEKYGENFSFYMQSYTESTSGGPTTDEASDWTRSNRRIVDRHQSVYGFFAPQEDDEFDYQSYLRQFKSKERVSLTPEQFVARAQDRVGKMIYYNAKDRFGTFPTRPQREWLTKVREVVKAELPGYDKHLPLPEKYDKDTLIADLRTAASSGDFADRPVTEALQAYFAAYDKANQSAATIGIKRWSKAKGTGVLREWMRNIGELLATEVPDFRSVWDRVLEGELLDDGGAEEAIQGAHA